MSLLPDVARYGWLFLFRLLPALLLVPAFGGRWGGRLVQGAVALLLALALVPALVRVPFAGLADADLAAIALKELVIGTAIGIFGALVLYLAESLAAFVGAPSGSDAPEGTLRTAWSLLFLAVFFAVRGPHLLLSVLLESYRLFPLVGQLPDLAASALVMRAGAFFALLAIACGPLFCALLATVALEAYVSRALFAGQGSWLGPAGVSYLVLAASALALPLLLELLARESVGLLRHLLAGS